MAGVVFCEAIEMVLEVSVIMLTIGEEITKRRECLKMQAPNPKNSL